MVDGRARFVNETRLNIAPSIPKIPFYTVSEKRFYFRGIVTIAVFRHANWSVSSFAVPAMSSV
jgi:hypothetical protein